MRKHLLRLSSDNARIFASSANDLTFLASTTSFKRNIPQVCTLVRGLTAEEATSWWKHRYPDATEIHRTYVDEVTGRIPLWMEKLAASKVFDESSQAVISITEDLLSWVWIMASSVQDHERFVMIVLWKSTILKEANTVNERTIHLVDHRFMMVGEGGNIVFTCPIAFNAAVHALNHLDPGGIPAQRFLDVVGLLPDNKSVQGYALEAAILQSFQETDAKRKSYISTGKSHRPSASGRNRSSISHTSSTTQT